MNEYKRWHWVRRFLLICGGLLALLVVVIAIVWFYVDWSGKHRWSEVQAMLAREGESLDFRKVAPDPVPDEKNFCAIPALKDLAIIPDDVDPKSPLGIKRARFRDVGLSYSGKVDPAFQKALTNGTSLSAAINQLIRDPKLKNDVPRPKMSQGVTYGKPCDLAAWAAWLHQEGTLQAAPDPDHPEHDVLAALAPNDALINELATGLQRPESQWTPSWKTRDLPEHPFMILHPEFEATQALAGALFLRSAAAARAGEAAKAHESLMIMLRLNQANMNEPLLISILVDCGISTLASSAVWELCDAHAGTADDYRRLQETLARLDYRKTYLYAERSELTFGADVTARLKRTKNLDFMFGYNKSRSDDIASFALHLIPDGWMDNNEATIAQWHFDYYIKPLRDAGFDELLARRSALEAIISEQNKYFWAHFNEFLALTAMPGFSNISYKVIATQSLQNQSIAACALERYRIEHGRYPDRLDMANHPGESPIPLDVISGKPMGYRRTPGGRYLLWCVSFSGKDNGGKRVLDEKDPEHTKFSSPTYQGDWVWDYPAPATSGANR